MKGNSQGVAEPEGSTEGDAGVGRQERERHVAPEGTDDDEAADAHEEKGQDRGGAPLTRGHPGGTGGEDGHHDREVRRVEDVLAADAEDELAADGQDGGQHGHGDGGRAEQQAKREGGDEGAPGIERPELREGTEGCLRQKGCSDERHGPSGRHVETELQGSVEEQPAESRDLQMPWVVEDSPSDGHQIGLPESLQLLRVSYSGEVAPSWPRGG